jgi:hypothetical protein
MAPARCSTPPAPTSWPSTSTKRPAGKPQCGPCVSRAAVGSVARRAPARVRCIPLTRPRHLSCPSAGYVNPAAACAVWIEGARGLRDGGMRVAAGSRPRRRRAASGRASGHQRPVTTVTDESPRPVTARRSAPGIPGPVPHRPAAGRGRPRLRAPDRGSGERRCHRPGWPMGAGVCVVWRWRRKQLDAARATLPAREPCPRATERGADRSPAPSHGPRSAACRSAAPFTAWPRGHVAAIVGRSARWPTGHGTAGGPETGTGATRSRVTRGSDVTPTRAGENPRLPRLDLRFSGP